MSLQLSPSQKIALQALEREPRLFLTGGAGTGKSFLLREYLRAKEPKRFPILASTGAAAVLVGGRTFHSFFSLGIMEGGVEESIERALKDDKLYARLQETEGLVIDEVSMISADAFRAAEAICRLCLDPTTAWGGLKLIAVGDFFQLPPVSRNSQRKDWCFLDPAWQASQFFAIELKHNMRSEDPSFVDLLADLRLGVVSDALTEFLNSRLQTAPEDKDIVHLYARKNKVETHNLRRLEEIDDAPVYFPTVYQGERLAIDSLKRNAPVPEELVLKIGAFVMLRQNDPIGRFVNGSLGYIREIYEEEIEIELLQGRWVRIEKSNFSLQDADGRSIAVARNFPISLAYATTIHKAQGTSLDRMQVDLSDLWEPGHAYVALSRARQPQELYIESWRTTSLRVSPEVVNFYRQFLSL